MRIQDKKTYNATMRKQKIQCGGLQLSSFIKYGRKLFSIKRNLFIEGNIRESKKRNKIMCQIFSKFYGEKYNKCHIYKIKTIAVTSANTHP